MMVAIVGTDGCGKTTQISRCLSWIHNEFQLPARMVTKTTFFDRQSFPECFFDCTPSEMGEKYFPLMKGHSRALLVLHGYAVAFGRYPPKDDEVVMVDGYWQKLLATEAAMGLDPKWLENASSVLPRTDIVIMLDINPTLVLSRGRRPKPYECGCDFSCSDDAFLKHQGRAREILLSMATKNLWPVIDARSSIEEVFSQVTDVIHDPIYQLAEGVRRPLATASH